MPLSDYHRAKSVLEEAVWMLFGFSAAKKKCQQAMAAVERMHTRESSLEEFVRALAATPRDDRGRCRWCSVVKPEGFSSGGHWEYCPQGKAEELVAEMDGTGPVAPAKNPSEAG